MLLPLIFLFGGFIIFTSIAHFARKYDIFPEVVWMLLFGIVFGLGIRFFSPEFPILSYTQIQPDIILYLFVPILIFASARKFSVEIFEKILTPTLILTFGGTLLSSFVIGGLSMFFFGLSFGIALLLGIILSAVDPLAVSSLLKESQNVSESKKELIEGESILNDGVVITLFGAISLLLFKNESFSISHTVIFFIKEVGIALAVGSNLGFFIRKLLDYFHEDYFVMSINITLFLAFGSFILADTLGGSGIISVFSAALAFGYHPSKVKHQKHVLGHFWQYLEESLDNILFFLLGVTFIVSFSFSKITIWFIFGALLILLASRGLSLGVLYPFLRVKEKLLTKNDLLLLNFSASRGAISIVLILLLPKNFLYYDFFFTITCFIIIVSLIVYPQIVKYILQKNKN